MRTVSSCHWLMTSLAVMTTSLAHGEELECSSKQAFRGGGGTETSLTLTTNEGRPTKLSFITSIATGRIGGGYVCAFDSAPGDALTKWSTNKSETVVSHDAASEDASHLRIHKLPGGYRVTFDDMSRIHCGFGAEFPRSVEIRAGNKRCIVVK
jgi:hypothetical protein